MADLLPRELNGVELQTFAVGEDAIARLQANLGIARSELQIGYASEHRARFFQMYAMRVVGFDGPSLLDAFAASAYDPSQGEVTDTEQTIGGLPVTVVAQPATLARLGTFYATVGDDALLVVQAFERDVAAEALAALP